MDKNIFAKIIQLRTIGWNPEPKPWNGLSNLENAKKRGNEKRQLFVKQIFLF